MSRDSQRHHLCVRGTAVSEASVASRVISPTQMLPSYGMRHHHPVKCSPTTEAPSGIHHEASVQGQCYT
jgi:hypothetical protein